MEIMKSYEEILSEYFLVETEKTKEIKGWKVIGTLESCSSSSVSPILEFKTDDGGWLCDFRIKLLHCGLVLCSPEYVIDEDDLIMEAVEKIWKVWGMNEKLQEILEQQLQDDIKPVCYPSGNEIWTTTTSPITTNPSWWTNTITCSASTYTIEKDN